MASAIEGQDTETVTRLYGLSSDNLYQTNDLFSHLGMDKSLVLLAFPYVQTPTKRHRGCQIDILIQTQRTLIAVEIKRCKEIGYEVVDEVSEKVKRLAYTLTSLQ